MLLLATKLKENIKHDVRLLILKGLRSIDYNSTRIFLQKNPFGQLGSIVQHLDHNIWESFDWKRIILK